MLRGIIVPLITPFRTDGTVCSESVARLLESLVPQVAAVVPCLTTGEGWLLSEQHWAEMVALCLKYLGRERVIAGLEVPSTDQTLVRAKRAAELGCATVISTKPFGSAVTQARMVDHYAALGAVSGLNFFVYNEAWLSGNTIQPETYTRLAGIPQIAGIKESTGDAAMSQWLSAHRAGLPPIFQGREELLEHTREFDGFMVALANLAPGLCARAFEQADSRTWAELARLCATHNLLTDGWIQNIKLALHDRGVIATSACLGDFAAQAPAVTQTRVAAGIAAMRR